MIKIKSIISCLVATGILISGFSVVGAENTLENESTDVWNSLLVDAGTEGLYADFPVRIDKAIRKDMRMDLSFQYLKNLDPEDSVVLTITDMDSNTEITEKTFSSSENIAVFQDVPNEKTYAIEISETIDNVSKDYTGYVETKYVPTDFPVNMTLGSNKIENVDGKTASNVLIKQVGNNPVCTHAEDEPCTDDCSISSVVDVLEPEDLDTFYDTLIPNSFYEIQTEAESNGEFRTYQGFISTFDGGENDGIFTRGYVFYKNLPSEEPPVQIQRAPAATPDFDNALVYQYYQNEYISMLSSSAEYVIKFIPPYTGSYTIETIGNADTMFRVYTEVDGSITEGSPVRDGGVGENAQQNIEILVTDDYRPIKYYVLTLEDGPAAPCAFRIIRNDDEDADDFTNYRDVVQDNCNNGIYSEAENKNCVIDYHGDVDIFGYNVSSGVGYVGFDNLDPGLQLQADIYSAILETPFDEVWREDTFLSPTTENPTEEDFGDEYNFSSGRHYIQVKQVQTSLPDFNVENDDYYAWDLFSYDFRFYEPSKKDALDSIGSYGNNTPMSATEISSLPYSRDDLTLHKGDADYFKFTTSSDGGNIEVKIGKTSNGLEYIPCLYDEDDIEVISSNPPDWMMPDESMADYVQSGNYQILNYDGLLPKHSYYIKVERTVDNKYSSYFNYSIDITLTDSSEPDPDPDPDPSDSVIELTTVTNESVMSSTWDWVGAARMVANSRLTREGSALTTKTVFDALIDLNSDYSSRGTLAETAEAANYFYTNGESTDGAYFIPMNVDLSTAENTLFNSLSQGKAVILHLTSATSPEDMSKARYLVLYGINKENHTYKIMDPTATDSTGTWISQDIIHNGGYNNNDDLRFTGTVIEFRP